MGRNLKKFQSFKVAESQSNSRFDSLTLWFFDSLYKSISSTIIVLFLIPFFLSPITIFAQSKNGGLDISPAYSDITVGKPGERKEILFTFTNRTQTVLQLELFPIDFSQTGTQGTISFLNTSAGNYTYSLASFLSFASRDITINTGEKVDVPVTVTNRPDLRPGGHYAAVVARLKNSGDTSDETKILPSVAGLIYLRKTGGERYNISLKDIQGFPSFITFSIPKTVTLLFQNEGNVHLVPYGRVDVTDMTGKLVQKGIVNTPSYILLPESRRKISVSLDVVGSLLPISLQTMKIYGHDAKYKTTYLYQNTFLYINPMIAVGFIICIVFAILLVRKRKKT
jgi:hypothetical protein